MRTPRCLRKHDQTHNNPHSYSAQNHGHVENDESWYPTTKSVYEKMDAVGKIGRLRFPWPLFAYPFYLFNRSPGKVLRARGLSASVCARAGACAMQRLHVCACMCVFACIHPPPPKSLCPAGGQPLRPRVRPVCPF